MSKQTTNYNERLDEIVRNAYSGEVSWIYDQLDGTSFIGESLEGVEKNIIDTKQAITSLIKELVAEAKPGIAKNSLGWNEAADQFEQNLLKALEEV